MTQTAENQPKSGIQVSESTGQVPDYISLDSFLRNLNDFPFSSLYQTSHDIYRVIFNE